MREKRDRVKLYWTLRRKIKMRFKHAENPIELGSQKWISKKFGGLNPTIQDGTYGKPYNYYYTYNLYRGGSLPSTPIPSPTYMGEFGIGAWRETLKVADE